MIFRCDFVVFYFQLYAQALDTLLNDAISCTRLLYRNWLKKLLANSLTLAFNSLSKSIKQATFIGKSVL
jgi:hypothetical protein